MLNRQSILDANDLKSEKVPCPEWGGDVFIRTMSGVERDAFETATGAADGKYSTENLRAKLLILCMVDENGNRLFTDADAPALGKKSAKVLDRLFPVALRMNGLGKDDVEALAKN